MEDELRRQLEAQPQETVEGISRALDVDPGSLIAIPPTADEQPQSAADLPTDTLATLVVGAIRKRFENSVKGITVRTFVVNATDPESTQQALDETVQGAFKAIKQELKGQVASSLTTLKQKRAELHTWERENDAKAGEN